MTKEYKYQQASVNTLALRWDKNIADNIGDDRWIAWKAIALENLQAKSA
jgi:hypothetical protein